MRREPKDDLQTVGEFAESTGVPARTLRYCDRIGLFRPTHVDSVTRYRYYSPRQLQQLTRILALKELGLSLDQIRSLVANDLPPAELRRALRLKRTELRRRLERGRAQLDRVDARLTEIEQDRLTSVTDGGKPMASCSRCERRIPTPRWPFCPHSGQPRQAAAVPLLPFAPSAKHLAVRAFIPMLVAVSLLIGLSGAARIRAGDPAMPKLVPRSVSSPHTAKPKVALLSTLQSASPHAGTTKISGQMLNISDEPLADISAIVSLHDADPDLIAAQRASVDCGHVSPGELCSFEVEVDSSPRARYYGLILQHASGASIPMRDDRDG